MPPVMLEEIGTTEKRGRRGGPKSKSGCNICKTRRIKCDETRPACLKCTRSGWTCPGYPISKTAVAQPRKLEPLPLKAADSSDDSRTRSLTPPLTSPSSSFSSSSSSSNESFVILTPESLSVEDEITIMKPFKNPLLDFPGTREEHRLFNFYRARTAFDFEIHAEYTNFYNLVGGQLGLMEKPIRHALITLAAVHEDRLREIENQEPVNERFALLQCNKAIRSLNKRLAQDKPSHQLTLIMCLLFTSIESMNKSPIGAFSHVRSGAALLDAYLNRFGSSSMDELDKKLALTFAGYRTGGVATQPVDDDQFYLPMAASEGSSLDSDFTSIDEANERLNALIGWSFAPESEVTDKEDCVSEKEISQRLYMINQLEKWAVLLGRFMTIRLSTLTVADIRMIRVLRAQNIVAVIDNYKLMAGGMTRGEMELDNHMEEFEMIIRLAEQVITEDERSDIEHQSKARADSISNQSFISSLSHDSEKPKTSAVQFEAEVTYALATVAEKCRSPSVRRHALNLLHRSIPYDKKAAFYERCSWKAMMWEEGQCEQPVTEDRATWPKEHQRITESWHTPIYDHMRKTHTILFEHYPKGAKREKECKYHLERVHYDDDKDWLGVGG